jgi:hypothetical protein
MAIERHCMYHCKYQLTVKDSNCPKHRGERIREMARAALFDIHLMRVNLTWMDGANSRTPPCKRLDLPQ